MDVICIKMFLFQGISEELQSINKSSAFTKRQERSDEVINPENNIKFNVINFEKKIMPSGMRTTLSQPVLITKISSHHNQSLIRTFGSSEVTRCYNGLHHGSLENIRNYLSVSPAFRFISILT